MATADDSRTRVILVSADGTEVEVGRLPERDPDLAQVDALARLQLAARRRGWTLRVRGATDELRGLLELVGLAGVLRLEGGRQVERGEHVRADEVVEPGDAVA
jgi:hypothetical protein